jgi:hypothetical protein
MSLLEQGGHMSTVTPKLCFVVSPIGSPDSPERKRANGVLREVIAPVAEAFGYQVERADHDKAPGMVTEAIVRKTIEAPLVIADLHAHNPNVMYEVAIRHATGRPIIQMIQEGETLPFDIGGLNTVFYDPSVDGLAAWRANLRASLEAVQAGRVGENPVSRASLFQALQKRHGSEGEALAALMESVEQLRLDVWASGERTRRQNASSRVLVPPDQYMEQALTTFLSSDPRFEGRHFIIDVEGKTVNVAVLPRSLHGNTVGALKYEFQWEPDARIDQEVRRLQAALILDVTPLPQEASPAPPQSEVNISA